MKKENINHICPVCGKPKKCYANGRYTLTCGKSACQRLERIRYSGETIDETKERLKGRKIKK